MSQQLSKKPNIVSNHHPLQRITSSLCVQQHRGHRRPPSAAVLSSQHSRHVVIHQQPSPIRRGAATTIMHVEIQVALNFVISYLYNKLPRRRVNLFGEELEKALKDRFLGHWYPEKPFKVGYICLIAYWGLSICNDIE